MSTRVTLTGLHLAVAAVESAPMKTLLGALLRRFGLMAGLLAGAMTLYVLAS